MELEVDVVLKMVENFCVFCIGINFIKFIVIIMCFLLRKWWEGGMVIYK